MNERELFIAAVQIEDPTGRSACLDQACGGDAELRQRVEALLAAFEQAGSFLQQPAVSADAGATSDGPPVVVSSFDQEATTTPGTVIGPYKLLQQIGEGGMGTVFMAEQTHPVQRKVALKVIRLGMDSRQVIARFEAERQALALMDHVSIARVFDAGATENGRPYFVMELVHGVPITRYCDDNRLTPRQRLELFVPVCQAIQHAHQKGIIHRDVKPSNVMVTLYDGKPVPKVIDFGVAKATEQKLTERTLFTQYGTMVGTLEYMSPEQAEMSALGVDTRSDIYSLGVLLYELLTGSTPLSHKRVTEAAYAEILRMIREEEPPRPSTRLSDSGEALASISAQRHMEPAKLSKLMRGELDWIVMKALEKDRNRRYETANAFVADVQRYLNDEPVQACPPSGWYRLRKFVRRNRTAVVTVAVVTLAVLAAAGSIGWVLRDRQVRATESERQEAARLANVERGVVESLNAARTLIAENKLVAARQQLAEARAQLGQDAASLGSLAADIEALAADLNRVQQFLELMDQGYQAETTPTLELAVATSTDGPAAMALGNKNWERQPAQAVPFLLKALALYAVLERADWTTSLEAGLLGKDQVQQIRRSAYEALLWLADDVWRRQQEHPSARKLSPKSAAGQALVYLARAETAHVPTLAFYTLGARCQQAIGEEAAAQASKQLADKTLPTMALDHYLLGQAAYDARDKAAAVREFQAALHLEPSHYWSLMRLGYCLTDLGEKPEDHAAGFVAFTGCVLKRPDHAHAYYCRGIASYNLDQNGEALADFSMAIALEPMRAPAWCSRGNVYRRLGQLDHALADLNRAIELDPKLAWLWNSRGQAYRKLGQVDKALADCTKAIELDPNYAPAWYNRGALCIEELYQYDKALVDFTKAVELDPKCWQAWYTRGLAHAALGQPEKALADYCKTIELDPSYAPAWYVRGNVYKELGQRDKALADYTRAIELKQNYAMAWTNRGITYCDLGQLEKALADLNKALELDPKLVLAWYNRGVVCFEQLHQYGQALADFTKAIELDPKFVQAWYNRGQVHGSLGQPDKALADYTRVIELQPDYALAWYNRGITYCELRQLEKALADYSRAIDLDPTYAQAWSNRGAVYYLLRQPEKALADLNKALELDPKLVQAWYNRGALYRDHLDQYDKAIADFTKATEVNPKYVPAWNDAAWLLATCPKAKFRDPSRAVELAKKAVALAPNNGSFRNTLGVAHYLAGNWKEAVAALEKSMELSKGGDSSDWFFLAMAHWKLGQKEEARKWYEKAVAWMDKYQPQNDGLRRFRSEAEQLLGVLEKRD